MDIYRFNFILDEWSFIMKMFLSSANFYHKQAKSQGDQLFSNCAEYLMKFFLQLESWTEPTPRNSICGSNLKDFILGEISLADFCLASLYTDLIVNRTGTTQVFSDKLLDLFVRNPIPKTKKYLLRMQ
jgi:hypothetical protein